MRYFIEHLGDSKLYYSQLEKNSRLERLRQEDSKERIILRNGGGIFVISAQQRNASKSIEAAMGEGAKVVIGDEFNLIQDTTEATIFRMIAGKGPEAFYCKIGNPFYSMPPYSHFKTTWESALYHKIFIDAAQALKEGRYTQEFLDEAKDKPLYSILFDCEFPPEDVIDEKGYRPLLVSDSFKFGVTRALMLEMLAKARAEGELKIRPKLGCDIAGGGDDNAYVVRWGKFACVAGKNRTKDTMVNIGEIEGLMKEFGVKDEDVSIDDIGIGRGVTDRMIELGHNVNGVNVGEPAKDSETYANLKAELNWNAKKWIEREDSRLNKNDDWLQGTWVKYKVNSDKQLKLESKEDLKKKHGSKSPDIWDAFVLTFYEPGFVGFI